MSLISPLIIPLSKITTSTDSIDVIPLIERGFQSLSLGQAVVPPVGEMLFDKPKGDVHIKYGYIRDQEHYVIKIASGFYDNPALGLSSSQGLMLVFSQQTGELRAILLDEGYLTDIRTAVASMITLQYLAPNNTTQLGIIGTGTQARLQLKYLDQVSDCKNIMVWGRNADKAQLYKEHFSETHYKITVANDIGEIAVQCQTIITTTPSYTPLLNESQIQKGTHITSLGSDTSEKIELDPSIIKKADVLVSDSIEQSKSRGEIYRARLANCLDEQKVIELGNVISNPQLGRTDNNQITIADLTGVAVQDIMIAEAVYSHFNQKSI